MRAHTAAAVAAVFAAAVVAAVSGAAAQSLAEEYDGHVRLARTTGQEVDVWWTVNAPNETVSFAVRGPRGGYLALALSTNARMIGSQAFLAFEGVGVAEYLLESKFGAGASTTGGPLTNTSVEVDGDFLLTRFTRAYAQSDYTIDPDADTSVAYALGPTSGAVTQHRRRGSFATIVFNDVCLPKCGGDAVCNRLENGTRACECPTGFTGDDCDEVVVSDAETLLESEYDSNTRFSGTFRLFWSIRGSVVDFAVFGTGTGYYAFGYGSNMIGSTAFIARVIGGVSTVAEYKMTSKTTGWTSSGVEIPGSFGSEDDGRTVVRFTRPITDNGFTMPVNETAAAVWAQGSGDSITQHAAGSRGRVTINLVAGTAEATDAPAAVRAHAILMTLGLGIMLPVGVAVARYSKKGGSTAWFQIHRALQSVGTLFAFIAVGVIIDHAESVGTDHFSHTHGLIGIIIVALCLVQVLGGALRPHIGTPMRAAWLAGHRIVGVFIVVASLLNVFGGLSHNNSADNLTFAWAAWVAVYVAAIIFFEVRRSLSKADDTVELQQPKRPLPSGARPGSVQDGGAVEGV